MLVVLLRANMLGHSPAIVLLILVCSCLRVAVHAQNTVGWGNKKAEVCFLLDSSSSVWREDYNKLLTFVSSLVSDMDIGPSTTRVGVGVFAAAYRQHLALANNLSKDQLRSEIMRAPYLTGDGYISRGLHGLRQQCLSRSLVRPQVPLIAVLFTDGESRHKQLTADNATLMKEEGVSIFTIGIKNAVDRNELNSTASDPKKEFNYHVDEFNLLANIRSQLSSRMSQVQIYQEEGTCGKNAKADTMFVFNEAAFGHRDSKNIKAFIAAVIHNFSMNSGSMRASVISKCCPEEDIVFGQYIKKEDFIAGLQNSNGPDINELLRKVMDFLQNGNVRQDAKIRIVMFLPASLPRKTDTMLLGNRIKYSGVETFVIVIGNGYDSGFINSLASAEANIMFPDSTDDLIKQEWIRTFNHKFCPGL